MFSSSITPKLRTTFTGVIGLPNNTMSFQRKVGFLLLLCSQINSVFKGLSLRRLEDIQRLTDLEQSLKSCRATCSFPSRKWQYTCKSSAKTCAERPKACTNIYMHCSSHHHQLSWVENLMAYVGYATVGYATKWLSAEYSHIEMAPCTSMDHATILAQCAGSYFLPAGSSSNDGARANITPLDHCHFARLHYHGPCYHHLLSKQRTWSLITQPSPSHCSSTYQSQRKLYWQLGSFKFAY